MSSKKETKQIHVRVDDETKERISYWAAKMECSSNEFISDAIDHYIAYLNHDYDVPDILVHRMDQLMDHVASLDSSVRNEQRMISSGFNSLLGLTRGDNYLLEEESGEL